MENSAVKMALGCVDCGVRTKYKRCTRCALARLLRIVDNHRRKAESTTGVQSEYHSWKADTHAPKIARLRAAVALLDESGRIPQPAPASERAHTPAAAAFGDPYAEFDVDSAANSIDAAIRGVRR